MAGQTERCTPAKSTGLMYCLRCGTITYATADFEDAKEFASRCGAVIEHVMVELLPEGKPDAVRR